MTAMQLELASRKAAFHITPELAAKAPRAVAHLVPEAAFQIDVDLVSNAHFARFVEDTGHKTSCEILGEGWTYSQGSYGSELGVSWRSFATPLRAEHPVTMVSWADAKAYAAWAGMRLPSEWEWELAASAAAGVDSEYPWCSNRDPFAMCGAGKVWRDGPGTSPVGQWPHGLLNDAVGNVWQWCENLYEEDPEVDALPWFDSEQSQPTLRARRGGAWNVLQPFRLRAKNRGAYPELSSAPNIGFRCARDL